MTREERIKLYAALAAPFPEEAIERTEGAKTGRGYDTTGVKYQYVVDRLNEVLGVGGFRTDRTITVRPITTAKGRPAFEAIAEVRLELGAWTGGEFLVFAQAWGDGGHTSMSESDARKGAYTNALKKAAGFVGPGRDAYRGTIDDDHVPTDESVAPTRNVLPVTPHVAAAPRPVPHATSGAHNVRDRLSSKQYGALRSLSQAAGYDAPRFKEFVRTKYGVEAAHLSRSQASDLIGLLIAANNGAREAG